MLKIRLQRVGGKKKPSYRIVLCDSRVSKGGRVIEQLGNYNPKSNPPLMGVKKDRIDYWVKKGAQFSDRVDLLLKEEGKATTGGLNEVTG